EIAHNDNREAGDLNSEVQLTVGAGQTYYIKAIRSTVAVERKRTGAYVLNLTTAPSGVAAVVSPDNLLACLPGDCNLVFGLDVGRLTALPALKGLLEQVRNSKDGKDFEQELGLKVQDIEYLLVGFRLKPNPDRPLDWSNEGMTLAILSRVPFQNDRL